MEEIRCRLTASDDEREQCFEIRRRVFVQEQRLFAESDRDGLDETALHIAAFLKDRIIGTVRIYQDESGAWWGGRLAVLRKYRGRAGRELVQAATHLVRQRGGDLLKALVLAENINFFRTIGWRSVEPEFPLYGKPHLVMEFNLSSRS